MIFYKGVLKSFLNENFIPGTVAIDFKTAHVWKERIEGKKAKGASKHIKHGHSVVIEIHYDGMVHSHDEFQVAGVSEHNRKNCWTSAAKDKAQINVPCKYRVLNDEEINQLFTL